MLVGHHPNGVEQSGVGVLVAGHDPRTILDGVETVAGAVASFRSIDDVRPHIEAHGHFVAILPVPAQVEVASCHHVVDLAAIDANLGREAPIGNTQADGEGFALCQAHPKADEAVRRKISAQTKPQGLARRRNVLHREGIEEIDDGTLGRLHHGEVRYIGQSHRSVQVTAGNGQAVDVHAPSTVGDFLTIEQVDIAKAVARRFHRPQQAVVDVFLDSIDGRRVAGEAKYLAAKLHPRDARTGLHHALNVRVSLFKRGMVPSFAVDGRMIGLISPTIARNGHFVAFHVLVQVQKRLLQPGVALHAIVFHQSFIE